MKTLVHDRTEAPDLRAELLGALGQLWRQRRLIIITAWAVCLIGWAGTMLWPNRYEARARIYVDTETLLSPLLKGMSVVSNVDKQAAVMQRTLLARQNLETVLHRHWPGLKPDDTTAWEQALRRLESATTVEPEGGRSSNLFLVTHRSASPQQAKDIVETLLGIFIAGSTEGSRKDIAEAREFIDSQLEHYEGLLRAAEARLAEFKRANVGLLPQNGNYAQSVEAARARLGTIRGDLEEARTRRDSMRAQLADTPRTISVDGAPQVVIHGTARANEPASRIAEQQAAIDALLLRYTDRHPDVIAARRLLEQMLAQRGQGGSVTAAPTGHRTQMANPLHDQIRLKLVDLEAEALMLEKRLADQRLEVERLNQMAATVPAIEAEHTALNRDYDVLKSNYEQLLGRRESAKLSDEMQSRVEKVQFSVVEAPSVPIAPVVPNRPLLLSAVLAGGLVAGALLVLVRYQLRRPVLTVQQLRDSFAVRVIGDISRVAPNSSRRLAGHGVATAAAALVLTYGALMLWVLSGSFAETVGRAL